MLASLNISSEKRSYWGKHTVMRTPNSTHTSHRTTKATKRYRLRALVALVSVVALSLSVVPAGAAFAGSTASVPTPTGPAPKGTVAGGDLGVEPTPTSPEVATAPIESWTPTSHSVTVDDQTTLDLFSQPAFKRGVDGWSAIDSTISASSGTYPFEALGLVNPVHFGTDASALITIDTVSGPVLFGLEGATVNPPTLKDGVVTYRQVFPGVDLQFTTAGGRIGKYLILADEHAQSAFHFSIIDPQHTLGQPTKDANDEGWTFSADVAFATGISLAAPAAWTQADKGPGLPGSAHQAVSITGTGYGINLSVDPMWAETAAYPLVLDPAVQWTDEIWQDDAGLAIAFGPIGATDCNGGPCQLADPVNGNVGIGTFNYQGLGVKSFLAYVGANVSVLSGRQVSSAVLGGYDYSTTPVVDSLCSDIAPGSTGADLAAARCGDPVTSTNHYATRPDFGWFTDVTNTVRDAVAGLGPTGSTAGFSIDAGGMYPLNQISTPGLRLVYTGYPVPRPLTAGQTFGCDCWAGHSPGNQATAADPVNTATGALAENFADLSVAGVGQTIDLSRTYNSLDATAGPFGAGWSFSYSASLQVNAAGELVFTDGSGTRTRFGAILGGGYAPLDAAVSASLSDGPDSTHVMRNLAGDTMTFNAAGQLIAEADERGQGLTLGYVSGALTTVTDALGQTLTFAWTGTGANARIVSATVSDGRKVSYTHTTTAGALRLTTVTAVDATKTKYAYASTGGLSSITDPLGHISARNTYDAAGRITSQIDQTGATTLFSWNSATQTATITDPTGKVRTDIYNNLNLVKQIDGNGAVIEQLFDGDNNPAAKVDAANRLYRNEYDDRDRLVRRIAPAPLNYTETWTYDDANHVLSHTDAAGNPTTYTYNSAGLVTSVHNPDGGIITTTYTTGLDGSPANLPATSSDPLGRITSYTYTAAGDLASVTTPGGHTTTSTYDAAHRRTSTTSPSGAVSSSTYDAAGRTLTSTDPTGAVTTNTYDTAGRLTKTTDALKHGTTFVYDSADRLIRTTDAAGRISSMTYDAAGRVATSMDRLGAITTSSYDAAGRLIGTTDALGHTTTNTYDALGQLIAVTGPTGGVTSYTYDVIGQKTSMTDPDGVKQTTTYDQRGLGTAIVNALGGTQQTSYDSMGRQVYTGDSDGVYTNYRYDLAGQLVELSRPTSTYISGYYADRTTFTYDADGRRTKTVEPRGNFPGATPARFTTSVAYDDDGRPVSSTDPLGRTVTTGYDAAGRPTTVTDRAAGVTTTTYNAMGWTTSVTDPVAGKTSYTYDSVGNLTKRTDPLGRATTFTYDKAGRVLTQTDALGRITAMTYDAVGDLTTLVKPSGTATISNLTDGTESYTYDAASRLTATTFSDATAAFAYAYSAAGRLQTAGRVKNGNVVASSTYTYDAVGHTISSVRTGPGGGTTNYSYTPAGRVSGAAWSTGMAAAYSYNSVGELITVTPSGTGNLLTVGYSYDPSGRVVNVTSGGVSAPTSTATMYDNAGQLTSLTHSNGTSVLDGYGITRDSRGNPTQVTTTIAGASTTALYGYDAVSRLTSECYPTTGNTCTSTAPYTTYTYDKVGNRKTQAARTTTGTKTSTISTAYTYDAAHELLTQKVGATATVTNTWTPNGALATSTTPTGTTTYATDLTDELISAALPTGTMIAYTHDTKGNRTSRTVGGTTQATWSWDDLSGLPVRIGEYDQIGSLATSWLPDTTSATGSALAESSGALSSWLLSDPFANVTAVIGTSGASVSGTRTLNAFGVTRTGATGSLATSAIGFAGQYLDAATGLYDMRARDYDPASGRFTANDPVAVPTGMPYVVGYSYALNNPLTGTERQRQFDRPQRPSMVRA